eukprot:365424-Chlamydomonas_euryale.AAC.18
MHVHMFVKVADLLDCVQKESATEPGTRRSWGACIQHTRGLIARTLTHLDLFFRVGFVYMLQGSEQFTVLVQNLGEAFATGCKQQWQQQWPVRSWQAGHPLIATTEKAAPGSSGIYGILVDIGTMSQSIHAVRAGDGLITTHGLFACGSLLTPCWQVLGLLSQASHETQARGSET